MFKNESEKDSAGYSSGATIAMALSGIAALSVIAACGAVLWAGSPAEGATPNEATQIEETVEIEPAEEHVHEWSPLTETVHHDAVTSTAKHPAEYAQQTACHTICNECGEVIDNAAEAHIEATGHSGYTANVPREETVLVKDAWSEAVVVQDAYDEVKVNGSICLGCGEVQQATSPDAAK